MRREEREEEKERERERGRKRKREREGGRERRGEREKGERYLTELFSDPIIIISIHYNTHSNNTFINSILFGPEV